MTSKSKTQLDFAREIDFSQILTNPILDIAARLWEDDRYAAFKVCYRSMRRIDDLVDHRKEQEAEISAKEIAEIRGALNDWLTAVRAGDRTDEFRREFLETVEQFAVPIWPWERLCKAMIYDLEHDGFPTLLQFVRYAEGAAVAPASIFMHLCGVRQAEQKYRPPAYDIRHAARPLALYSYFVHIIRDFQKDQLKRLNYYADSIIHSHRLNRDSLLRAAEGREVGQPLRNLMKVYRMIAGFYRRKARSRIDEIKAFLEPRYQLSYEMIFSLYSQIYERIDPANGSFTQAELNPTPAEVEERIQRTIDTFIPATR